MDFKAISVKCAKVILIILNGCCILIALSTLIFAVVDTQVLKQYGEEYAAGTYAGDIMVMVVCWLVLSVATFGAVGALKDNVKILYLYIGFLMITMVVELLITIYVSVQRYGLEFRVTEWLREDFFKNTTGEDLELHRKLWDELQISYECCGLNGPDDYRAMHLQISLSCCPKPFRAKSEYAQKMLYKSCIESSSYYMEGCEDEVLDVIRSDSEWLRTVIITAFWFEAIGMLLAMYVANNVKNSTKVYKQTVRY